MRLSLKGLFMQVLIVEDDAEAAATMQRGLKDAGIEARLAGDGAAGLEAVKAQRPDVIILDRMMPVMDGVTMLQHLRGDGQDVPVLFLSALGELEDRVSGLRAGADDYLVKPYALTELVARVEALGRRKDKDAAVETILRVGELEMNLISRQVKRQTTLIDLQPREFQLLEFLMRHAGQSVTRTMLLEKVWAYHFDPQTNVIDVHISRLRAKLDKGFDRPMLHTVRGEGYQLKA
jgi:two-component system OmpR family response regulator